MTNAPAHTPYDGSAKPFTIGLKPLDLSTWIELDHTYDAQMREKRRLFTSHLDDVFVEEPDTLQAQNEVFSLVRQHVCARFPERFVQTCKGIAIKGHPALDNDLIAKLPALHAASLLVQEDLILMRKGVDGWRLAAGALCFPSSWRLRDKFGRPLQDIHAPVPGFGRGTRNADLIHRMFDNLKVDQPVQRLNWSLQPSHQLYYPLTEPQRDLRIGTRPSKFADISAIARGFVRVERQTLRKLPQSGDILFTIRIYLDPLEFFQTHSEGVPLAAAFAEQLLALDQAQLDYKGLTADRDRLVDFLQSSG